MSSQRLIKKTTVSSSVSSVNITDVFNSDFDIYKIVTSDIVTDASISLGIRLINSSGSLVITDYKYSFLRMRTSGFNDVYDSSTTSWPESLGQCSSATSSGVINYIYNPYLSTSPTFYSMQGSFMSGTETRTYRSQGVQTGNIVNTGFQVFTSSDNITQGIIEVFGVREI
jgi:hypothetical protein